jgi:hypothetical protein
MICIKLQKYFFFAKVAFRKADQIPVPLLLRPNHIKIKLDGVIYRVC